MSAMHWEARRRQQVLDRRLSDRAKLENKQGTKEEQSEVPAVSKIDKQCICKCHLASEETGSVMLNKRYTSLQYSQQW